MDIRIDNINESYLLLQEEDPIRALTPLPVFNFPLEELAGFRNGNNEQYLLRLGEGYNADAYAFAQTIAKRIIGRNPSEKFQYSILEILNKILFTLAEKNQGENPDIEELASLLYDISENRNFQQENLFHKVVPLYTNKLAALERVERNRLYDENGLYNIVCYFEEFSTAIFGQTPWNNQNLVGDYSRVLGTAMKIFLLQKGREVQNGREVARMEPREVFEMGLQQVRGLFSLEKWMNQ